MNVRQDDVSVITDLISSEKIIARVKKSNNVFFWLSVMAIMLMFCAAAFAIHKSFEALNERAAEVAAKAASTEDSVHALLSRKGTVDQLTNSVSDLRLAQERDRRDIEALKASIQCLKDPSHRQQCP